MANFRKALKNYTSTVSIEKILSDISTMLVDAQATQITWNYENGRVSGVTFGIPFNGKLLGVRVPLSFEKTGEVLRRQKVIPVRKYHLRNYEASTKKDEERIYRTGLANMRDWLDAQLTLLLLEQVELPQLFLPYIMQGNQTVYELMKPRLLSLDSTKE